MSAVPGVESVGITDNLPLVHGRSWELIAKNKPTKPSDNNDAFVYLITPGYLQTMGIRVRAGRDFTWEDAPKSEKVIIINRGRSAARMAQ